MRVAIIHYWLVSMRGGTETIVDRVSGLFFEEQTVPAITKAIHQFEAMRFDACAIRALAEKFNANRFVAKFTAAVENALGRKLEAGHSPELNARKHAAGAR